MSILDARSEFCDATALDLNGAASYLIGDVIDLGAGALVGDAPDLWCVIEIDTSCTGGTGCTGQFHLCSDAQEAIAVNGTATYHLSSAATIAVATLVAGYRVLAAKLPNGTYERYLGIVQTTGTAAFTAGKVNAYLTKDCPTSLSLMSFHDAL